MTEKEMADALRGSEQAPIWRALIQLIEQLRSDFPVSAANCAGVNNALGMARDLGAHEALSQLLSVLGERRNG